MRASTSRRHPRRSTRDKRFRFETLDERALLAVVANGDGPYTTAEETTFTLPGGASETLIPRGSMWSYFDQMTNGRGNPATPTETYPTDDPAEADATPGVADAWNSPDFNTASSDDTIGEWATGSAVFGSGTLNGNPASDPDVPIATTVAGNESDTYTVTTYLFVKKFTVSATTIASNPTYGIDLLADDGGVLYLNGTEIGRYRMAAGAVTATQMANAGGPEGYAIETFNKTPAQITALLVAAPAENTIAFELHQNGTTSTDSGFDLSFSASAPGGVLTNDMIDNPTTVATVTITTQPTSGSATIQPNGSFTYVPAANFNGTVTFVYTVSNGAAMDAATVTINVTPVDDAPVARADTYATFAGTPLVVAATTPPAPTVLLPQGSAWDYLDKITNGTNGTPDETYPLDADSDAWNEADFDTGTSNAAIGAWGNGNAPLVFGALDCCTTATTLEGTAADHVTYLFRRTINLTPADVSAIATRGLRVRYVIDDGAVIYFDGQEVQRLQLPAAPAAITTNTRATGNGAEGTAGSNMLPGTFTIPPMTLTAGTHTIAVEVHQAAVGSSDAGFDGQLEIPGFVGILNNDTDVENDPITAITLVPGQGVQNGTLNVNQDGTFTYTPNANFTGADTFQYTVTANGLTSAPATVTINVVPGASTCTPNPDLNGVGGVNRVDFSILAANYGIRTGATAAQGDLNCDGAVGVRDLVILRNAFPSVGSARASASALIAQAPAVDRVFSEMRPRTQTAARASLTAGQRQSDLTEATSAIASEGSPGPSRALRANRAPRLVRGNLRLGSTGLEE
jgi:hypothetical protein